MKHERLKAIKPLTQSMVQLLKNCHKTDLNTPSLLSLYDQSAVKGLIDRGLIEQRPIVKNGKEEITCVVTDTGKLYLDHYFRT